MALYLSYNSMPVQRSLPVMLKSFNSFVPDVINNHNRESIKTSNSTSIHVLKYIWVVFFCILSKGQVDALSLAASDTAL